MDKLLEDIKKGHEFRKDEGWEITTTTDDIDYIIQQAEKVPGLERDRKYWYETYQEQKELSRGQINKLQEQLSDLKEKLSTVLGSYKIAFSQNERHRKLAESYKQVLNFYSNEKHYDRPYDNEDYFDYLPSEMDFDKGKRARQILRGESDD